MASKKTYVLSFVWLITLGGLIDDSLATHISKPVLIDSKTQYVVGDTVILHGWVDYNAQPAPDVLLNFRLTRPDGTTAVDQFYTSDQEGRFEFKFDTRNEAPGTYQMTITSHCLETHRYACAYKNQTLAIHLNNP
ncbi:hypothetical protein [Nitrosomonas sp. Nm166]|uniref:hypothetical protein n=1 Tax=Nitrosomonas sp. Nm166 TaxID=1881054 RepID=UPI0008E4813C|nr:hypothetical protein [Nitrosomonas sp. Nm166]SFE24331.1 hypothetical protein SAMN05428977_101068 [Nitrosomonas sp. Nm166]